RIVTGLVLGGGVLTCLILGGLPFFIMLMTIALLAQIEFYQLFWKGASHLFSKVTGLVCGAGIIALASGMLPENIAVHLSVQGLLIGATLIACFFFLLDYGRDNDEATLGEYALLPMGILYVPLLFSMAYGLTLTEMLLVACAVAASDTAAYFTGCAIGNHRIWPSVSPKKSWEGAIAGFFACVLVVFGIGWFAVHGGPGIQEAAQAGADTAEGSAALLDTMRTYMPDAASLLYWLLVGAAVAIAAQFGDFFESAIKRSANVKDSSQLLPGHGGFLDRIDSLLFGFPVYLLMKNSLSTDACAALLAHFSQ
ncbi:phosphatidate cytidylyltransferase, partial [Desulfovibrio sp. OttesenSCG-928-I05]|nr:phosphatidate cytidylyltransferase [Desulfovibrio sp. OttesenSCG-928-I05]